MSDVTVIGLGLMGSALARAFLAGGKSVTVWNRSPGKAAALEAAGAHAATRPADAIAASPVIVICLSDYAATGMMLGADGAWSALAGRLVLQLTSGTPNEARTFAARVQAHGGACLDGAIGAWPGQIGSPDASIVVSGPQGLFADAEPLLKLLAGNLTHMGEDIGHASAIYNAGLAYFAGHWIGFAQGAAICAAEGLDVAKFGETMSGLSPLFGEDMRAMGRIVAEGEFGNPESTLDTVHADIARLAALSGELNVSTEFPAVAAGLFARAAAAGHGREQPAAVVKVLRA